MEFKVGDHVTYKPYEIALKAVVKKVHETSPWRHTEDTPHYTLVGRTYQVPHPRCHGIMENKHDPVNCITSGNSIVESVHFVENKEDI